MVHCDTHLSPAFAELRTIHKRKYKLDPSAPSGVASASGKPLGYKRKDGYWILSYGGKQLLAHRVVWILTHGEIPEGMVIDHINRNPGDNHIENLRCVTQAVNLSNVGARSHCLSGEKYIAIDKRTGRFSVRIRRKSHGTYGTLEEAVAVRDAAIDPHYRRYTTCSSSC